jgi:hypothetical protein
MSPKANIVDPVKGNSTLVRPRFSPGLLLRDDDLRVGVEYTRDLSRMLFRSLFGCGVVCGLVVNWKPSCGKLVVTVASGVALNCDGDPIYVPQPVTIPVDPCAGTPVPRKLWVTLCLTEKCCAPRSAVCSCEDDDVSTVCTREQAGFEIRIVGTDPVGCTCGCTELPLPPPPNRTAMADGPATPTAAPVATQSPGRKKATTTSNQPMSANVPVSAPESGDCCWSVDPCSQCYKDHYAGKCGCCDNTCVVLAVLSRTDTTDADGNGNDIGQWAVNHSVRRFVRPMLMRDPQVWLEQHSGKDPCAAVSQTSTLNRQ